MSLVNYLEAAPYVSGAASAVVAAGYTGRLAHSAHRYLTADEDTRYNIRSAFHSRRTWRQFCLSAGLNAKKYPGVIAQMANNSNGQPQPKTVHPRIRTEINEFGFTAFSKAIPGIPFKKWQQYQDDIREHWGAERVKLWQPKSGHIAVRAFMREPLDTDIPSPLLNSAGLLNVKPGSLSCYDDILIGYTEDGEPIWINLANSAHGAIQGVTRSGKSITVNSFLANASLMRDVKLVIIDPNLGAVAPWWRTADVVSSEVECDEPIAILRELKAEMQRRMGLFWSGKTDRIKEFSETVPLILLVIDEVSNYTQSPLDKKKAETFRAELQAVAAQGAKFGIRLWLLGQKLDGFAISTATRTNLTSRLCHRVDTMDDYAHLFPRARELADTGLDATRPEIPEGVGIAQVKGMRTPARMRSVYLPTESCWDISDEIVDQLGQKRPLPSPRLTFAEEAAERAA